MFLAVFEQFFFFRAVCDTGFMAGHASLDAWPAGMTASRGVELVTVTALHAVFLVDLVDEGNGLANRRMRIKGPHRTNGKSKRHNDDQEYENAPDPHALHSGVSPSSGSGPI